MGGIFCKMAMLVLVCYQLARTELGATRQEVEEGDHCEATRSGVNWKHHPGWAGCKLLLLSLRAEGDPTSIQQSRLQLLKEFWPGSTFYLFKPFCGARAQRKHGIHDACISLAKCCCQHSCGPLRTTILGFS